MAESLADLVLELAEALAVEGRRACQLCYSDWRDNGHDERCLFLRIAKHAHEEAQS